MSTARDITNTLGGAAIEARLGVTKYAIRHAKRGLFPASWYKEIAQMCADAGIECPKDAFNFKKSPTSEAPHSAGAEQ